jgi:hypothetical protein
MRPVLVIVPLYRDAALAPDLLSSLAVARDDFAQIDGRLLIIMDPLDSRNGVGIDRQLSAVSGTIPTELLADVAGLGVIGAANRGLAKAIEENRDALILKPNVAVFPGTLVEMRAVAYLDHMIGFVSPRSNDRGIGALPHDDRSRSSALPLCTDSRWAGDVHQMDNAPGIRRLRSDLRIGYRHGARPEHARESVRLSLRSGQPRIRLQ